MKKSRKCVAGVKLIAGAIAFGAVGFLATPVKAQDSFGNQVVQFPADTTVEFEFKESHGAYKSTLGIINLDTNEETVLFREDKFYDAEGTQSPQTRTGGANNIGTPLDYLGTVEGGTVRNRLAEYRFRANTRYAFYLESVSPTGQTRRSVRSTSNLAAAFDGALDGATRGDITGVRIAWDDDGLPGERKDTDFDDFVIEAGGYAPAPCPPVR